ncbi:MAG: glycosyltransferase [Clostridiales bacterium]|nr:glycosyltransferase [Clostridiales bacterium]
MEKVNVLLSTYNGEKYLRTQIDSILNQTYPNIDIFVRDDGSTDGTCEILEDYSSKGLLHYSRGENIRWGKSFLTLLKNTPDGDYWAFADQDDYWMPRKIEWAAEWLQSRDPHLPLLYHGSYEMTKEDLETVIGQYQPTGQALTFRRALTDCRYKGFSMVINQALRDLMLQCDISHMSSHDWWATILATKFGEVFWDERIGSLHRRLDTSTSSDLQMKNRVRWALSAFQNGSDEIRSCAKEYVLLFGSDADKETEYASWFAEKSNLKTRLKKAFYPGRWRSSFSSDLMLRFLMLSGRI